MTSTPELATSVSAAAIDATLTRIPPLWPLKHFVAVNPFVGLVDQPFAQACSLLQRVTGAAPLLSRKEYADAYLDGHIQPADLSQAADDHWSVEQLLAFVHSPAPEIRPIATVADQLDRERPRAHWSTFITEEISKWCAVTFDENQTTWRSPWKSLGLFQAWREAAIHDRNPEAFGLHGFRKVIANLPTDSAEAIAWCLDQLGRNNNSPEDFLHRQLSTIAGWAGYVQYLVREDQLRGKPNPALRDLLAIRLAYDVALFQMAADDSVFLAMWKKDRPSTDASDLAARIRWQCAYEAGFQRNLANTLAEAPSLHPSSRPSFQAIFCIDVRSEVFRRHLEFAAPSAQTLGFAGFFGFPVAHQTPGEDGTRSRCPVLLVPPAETCEPDAASDPAAIRNRKAGAGAWKAFQNSAASCFSFVESLGLSFAAALSKPPATSCGCCDAETPAFVGGDAAALETRTNMAEGALRNMSLTRNFARLVLICGHGSQSANNPYASGLDCGACGGHAGDVNARLAANALNDPAVRAKLAERSIVIPADTWFVAGLHNTTTDDVIIPDPEAIPAQFEQDLTELRKALAAAGAGARKERAPSLGLKDASATDLSDQIRARTSDISQVRPEWGLANNAALIAAPRSRTKNLNLHGRAFLHDYNADQDPENKVLTLILCAPVVVASWINLQYYASRVDQQRYGSGNKVLHNVAGGIGVLEGNGGDLRTGLPLQSIHDGTRFIHEPRRLTVFIEVAPSRIDEVLAANPGVRNLFDNEWIHLRSLQGDQCLTYKKGTWSAAS